MPKDSNGNVPKTTFSLTDISPKDKPWDRQKNGNVEITDIFSHSNNKKHQRKGERTYECACSIGFSQKVNEASGEVSLKLDTARFCRVRFCPICEWRRSLMWKARFYEVLPRIIEEKPTSKFLFLTLTVRNCEIYNLKETLKLMNGAWAKLRRRKAFAIVQGFVKTVEITRGKDNSAHPHFHILLMVPPSYFGNNYMSQAKWTDLWKSSLKVDYTPVVNIKKVTGKKRKEGDETPSLESGLKEVFKYSVKTSDLIADDKWFLTLVEQLAYSRAISLGGYFKEILSEEALNEPTEEDLLLLDENGDSADSSELMYFAFMRSHKKYIFDRMAKKLPKIKDMFPPF